MIKKMSYANRKAIEAIVDWVLFIVTTPFS